MTTCLLRKKPKNLVCGFKKIIFNLKFLSEMFYSSNTYKKLLKNKVSSPIQT